VACFCGHLFYGPASRCRHCGTPVPGDSVRRHLHRERLDAPIAPVRDLEPREMSLRPFGAGRVLDPRRPSFIAVRSGSAADVGDAAACASKRQRCCFVWSDCFAPLTLSS
jgi:hypothetical protein